MNLEFDLDELSLADAEDIEDYAGCSLADVAKKLANNPPMKLMTAIIWITERRKNPGFTVEDARKTKINAIVSDIPKVASPNAEAAAVVQSAADFIASTSAPSQPS